MNDLTPYVKKYTTILPLPFLTHSSSRRDSGPTGFTVCIQFMSLDVRYMKGYYHMQLKTNRFIYKKM